MFLERYSQNSQEKACVRDYFHKIAFLGLWKRDWHKCFPVNLAKFLRTPFFTERLRTTASVFSFSEAATGGVLWKKVFLNFWQNSQENTFGLRNFQKHLFYRTPLDNCFWLFRVTLLTWGTANSVWKTSDEYSLYRNSNLRSTVQIYHFIFSAG